jgi:glycine/D-amino acid oxidase-like deaminating enzyme
MLRRILAELFPMIRGVNFTHAWGGNLGIPRDWFPSVNYDRATGFGSAGGYVGDGVATAEVAGRTLAHMITEQPSDLTSLPWVGHASPRWEPEPLRWIGVNAVTALFATADISERRTGRPSRAAKTFWRAIGH